MLRSCTTSALALLHLLALLLCFPPTRALLELLLCFPLALLRLCFPLASALASASLLPCYASSQFLSSSIIFTKEKKNASGWGVCGLEVGGLER